MPYPLKDQYAAYKRQANVHNVSGRAMLGFDWHIQCKIDRYKYTKWSVKFVRGSMMETHHPKPSKLSSYDCFI